MHILKTICKIAAVMLGTLPALLFVYLMATQFAGVSSNWGACTVLGLAGLIAAFYKFDFSAPDFNKKFCLGVLIYLVIVWTVLLMSTPKYTYNAGLQTVVSDAQFSDYTVSANAEKSTSGLLKPKPSYFVSSYYLYRAQAIDGTVRYIVFDPISGKSGFCENDLIEALASR